MEATKTVSQRKEYFAIQTAKHKKKRYEPRYKEVAPGVFIKTF